MRRRRVVRPEKELQIRRDAARHFEERRYFREHITDPIARLEGRQVDVALAAAVAAVVVAVAVRVVRVAVSIMTVLACTFLDRDAT